MQSRMGLRTEIIVNIVLLMGAAILFAGFLLIKLTERELLDQRLSNVTGTMEILARTLAFLEPAPTESALRAQSLFQAAASVSPMEAWGMVDRDLNPLFSSSRDSSFQFDLADLSEARLSEGPGIRLRYGSGWLPGREPGDEFVVVTVPVIGSGQFAGALQGRFSLGDVRLRVRDAQRMVFVYVLLFGAVLAAFGIYLLSRTVVRPVRRLRETTRAVAAGDLGRSLPEEGPREIADLSRAFNAMVGALRESRRQTEAHILSLQNANREVQQARDDLVRTEKLASVGRLAAGMAHEIGNPLGAVMGYLELLKADPGSASGGEIAHRALSEAGRIDRLVRDLLDYAAQGRDELEVLDPVPVVREARDLLAHQNAFEGLQVENDLPDSLPLVRGVRHKLLQVFVNLLLNARDASSRGGTTRISAVVEKEHVQISIADEGEGIDPEVLPHIFDPFFTTKPPGKGRGLGLSVCHRVIEEAGGRIEVASRPGEGCRFTVWLPRASVTQEG